MKENYSNYPSYEEMVEDALAYMDDVMIREKDVVAEDGKILVEFQVWGQAKGELEEQILTYFICPE